jgi:hypothetical protein
MYETKTFKNVDVVPDVHTENIAIRLHVFQPDFKALSAGTEVRVYVRV